MRYVTRANDSAQEWKEMTYFNVAGTDFTRSPSLSMNVSQAPFSQRHSTGHPPTQRPDDNCVRTGLDCYGTTHTQPDCFFWQDIRWEHTKRNESGKTSSMFSHSPPFFLNPSGRPPLNFDCPFFPILRLHVCVRVFLEPGTHTHTNTH